MASLSPLPPLLVLLWWQVAMLSFLQSREGVMANGHLFNGLLFAPDGHAGGTKRLDADWSGHNGLRGLSYEARSREHTRRFGKECELLHVVAHLGDA